MKSLTEGQPKGSLPELSAQTLALALKKQSTELVTILTQGTVKDFLAIEQGLTITAILDKARPIAMHIKDAGFQQVAAALDIHLLRLASALNVKHNLDSGQISTIVYDLLEMYPNETLEDFLFVFKRMRQGYYGETYHLLNQATVFACVKLHVDEKYTEKERQIKRMHQEEMERATQGGIDEDSIYKEYDRLKKEGPPPDKRTKSDQDDDYQKFRADFIRKQTMKAEKAKRNDKAKGKPEGTE